MTKKTLPYVYFEGEIVPCERAQISIASNSLQYGTTCFAGIRGYVQETAYKVFRLKDHYMRLMNASKIIGMNFFMTFEEFEKIIAALIDKCAPSSDFYIRAFLYSSTQELAPKPKGLKFEMGIYLVPLGHYFDPNVGMKLMVSSWRKFSDASLPTKAKAGGCYINSFMATAEALNSGYDEALVMDQEGYIVEASVANLLMSYRGRLIVPEVGSAQLEGITLRTAIELLQEEGRKVYFEKMDRSMVYTCDELLLLGTAAQVTFAESVDKRTIGVCNPRESHGGPGSICTLLRKKYKEIINGTHAKSKEWMTEFPRQAV